MTSAQHNAYPAGRWTGDTSNQFFVRRKIAQPEVFCFETNTRAGVLCVVTRAEALNLAAWLTALTNGADEIAAQVQEIARR